jgi:hypothetical protein
MASSSSAHPRAANGRFVKRSEVGEKNRAASQLALLSLGMVVGIAGFVFRPLWIVALVLFGILWGSLAAEQQRRSRSGKGVVAEVVDVVVDQAKDVAEVAQSKLGESSKDG